MLQTKIYEVVRKMTPSLTNEQLNELKSILFVVFENCTITEETPSDLMIVNDTWKFDLHDFITSKSLEGLTDSTLERYMYELNKLFTYLNKSIKDISSSDISKYMQLYKRVRGVCNSTLQGIRQIYSSFFTWCHDNERVAKNPMVQVEKIKVEKKLRPAFTDEEREKLFRAATSLRDKALLEFFYSTGVRVSECQKLNRSDIRWTTKDIIVYGKGNKERKVYLNDKSNMYLREYLESRKDDNEALFVSLRKPYNRISIQGIEDIFTRLGEKAGVSKSHPHRMRQTSITNAVNRGMPIQEAALFAGHSSTETTLIYWTADEESVKYHHKKYLSA